jgi:hypothetical protein
VQFLRPGTWARRPTAKNDQPCGIFSIHQSAGERFFDCRYGGDPRTSRARRARAGDEGPQGRSHPGGAGYPKRASGGLGPGDTIGRDPRKKVPGRTRCLAVDVLGLVVVVLRFSNLPQLRKNIADTR